MPVSGDNTKYVKADQRAVEGALDEFATSFGDLFTVERRTQIDITSHYPLSDERNEFSSTTNASVTSTKDESEIHLSADAATGETARLESAVLGRYVSGYASEAGLGVRIPTPPDTGQEYKWGYYDENNGFFFGWDDQEPFVGYKNSEVAETVIIHQSDWNEDTLSGTDNGENPSGKTLDLTDGHIFNIEFTWYGYGEIQFVIHMRGKDDNEIPITVHRESPVKRTSIQQPNLPLTVDLDTGTSATAMDMYVGGRQFAIYGDETTEKRIKSDKRLEYSLSGETWVPVMALRRKSGRSATKMNFDSIDTIVSNNVIIQIREDATISDGTFTVPTDVDAGETAVETNTDITSADQTSGRKEYEFISFGGGGGAGSGGITEEGEVEIRFTKERPIVIFARKISGQGGTLSTVVRWQEEW
jgi:hypothetical protein